MSSGTILFPPAVASPTKTSPCRSGSGKISSSSVISPPSTRIIEGFQGGVYRRLLRCPGVYFLRVFNSGTGGVLSAKATVKYAVRPLRWEHGGAELEGIVEKEGLLMGRATCEQILTGSAKGSTMPSDDENITSTVEDGDSLILETTPLDHRQNSSSEVARDNFFKDAVLFDFGKRYPLEQALEPVFYRDGALGLGFCAGQFSVGRGTDKRYFFFVPKAFMRLSVDVSFSWGSASDIEVDLGYAGSVSIPREIAAKPRKLRILSLDGGGVLGGSVAAVLNYVQVTLEALRSGARLQDYFDLVVGTSIGGLITLMLLRGLDIGQLYESWNETSQLIFSKSRSVLQGILFEGHSVGPIRQVLDDLVGLKPMLSFKSPRCAVTTTDVSHQPYQLYIHRNYDIQQPRDREATGAYPGATTSASLLPLSLIAWTCIAAPTYIKGPTSKELAKMGVFAKEETTPVHLVDGAFLANNPAMLSIREGAALFGCTIAEFVENHLEILCSVGTGVVTRQHVGSDRSALQILLNAPHLILEGSAVHRELIHDVLKDKGSTSYHRYNAPGIGHIPIDDSSIELMNFVREATEQYCEDEKYYSTNQMCRILLEGHV